MPSRVRPNPGTDALFDPHTRKLIRMSCQSVLYYAPTPDRSAIYQAVCEIPDDPHPHQPHLARIEATEEGREGFIGWWDQANEGVS